MNAIFVYGEKSLDIAFVERLASHQSLLEHYLVAALSDRNLYATDLFTSLVWLLVRDVANTRGEARANPGWKPASSVLQKIAEDPVLTREVEPLINGNAFVRSKPHELSIMHELSMLHNLALVEGTINVPSRPEEFCASRDKGVDVFTEYGNPKSLGLMGFWLDTVAAEPSMISTENWESECSPEEVDKFRLGRCTFTTFQGKDCLGPCDTKYGDLIVVLSGCKVPYVLREAKYDHSEDVKLYRLIGDCIVPGFMHGEIMDEEEKDQVKRSAFVVFTFPLDTQSRRKAVYWKS